MQFALVEFDTYRESLTYHRIKKEKVWSWLWSTDILGICGQRLCYYTKRSRAWYIVREVWERERERERLRETDGSDVTIIALKLVSLAKNSHFSFLPSHSSLLPSRIVTIVALKFAMSSHFPLPKKIALFVPTLSKGATGNRGPKKKWSNECLPRPRLFFPSKKWITNQSALSWTDLRFAICRFSQLVFIALSNLTHNLFFYFQ